MIPGGCLCGAIRYAVGAPLQTLMHCHCSRCRKHHGAPFATVTAVRAQDFRWLDGEQASLIEYGSGGRVRRSCGSCGSVAPAGMGEQVLVPAGNLIGELGDVASVHGFVGSKATWHTIADAWPQYAGAPPGWSLDEGAPPPAIEFDGAAHGSCLCGAVTFAATGVPARWLQCHCSRCRRGRSAAHGSNTFYPSSQFAWRTGRELVRTYVPPDALRFTLAFCIRCGGGAPVERANVPFVLIPAGLFDGELGARPQAHIHVASKATWYSFHDGLPQFPELPPS
jgi:hypothetical protein